MKEYNRYFKILFLIFVLLILILSLNFKNTLAYQSLDLSCEFKRVLKKGDKGLDVLCLQIFLIKEGFLPKNSKIQGYYDEITKRAVKRWQEKNNLRPSSGIFSLSSIKFYNTHYLKSKTFSENFFILNKNEILDQKIVWPEIKDDEILITSKGLSKIDEYLKFYFQKLDFFDKIKENSELLKELNLIFEESIQIKNLPVFSSYVYFLNFLKEEEKDLTKLEKRINLLQEIFKNKIKKLKALEVSNELKDFHKDMIAENYLELRLIEKFYDYKQNRITKEIFFKNLHEYDKLMSKKSADIKNKILTFYLKDRINQLLKNGNLVFKDSIGSFFIKKTQAQISPFPNFSLRQRNFFPFGGKITFIFPCTCVNSLDYGNLFGVKGFFIYVTGVRGGNFFASQSFLSSPLFYSYKSLAPSSWILGLAESKEIRCGVTMDYACGFLGNATCYYCQFLYFAFGEIIMAGTSLPINIF